MRAVIVALVALLAGGVVGFEIGCVRGYRAGVAFEQSWSQSQTLRSPE